MSLRAVLVHNIPESRRHGGARERRTDGSIGVNAVTVEKFCNAEVDVTAFSDGPVGSHAITSLVGAESLSEDDVDEPARVEGFHGSDDHFFDDVPEGAGVEVLDQAVGFSIVLEALFGVCEASFETGADAA